MSLFDDRRSAWNPMPIQGTPTFVTPNNRLGVALHWIGSTWTQPTDDAAGHQRCLTLVQSIQRQHITTNGWMDIGYNGMICPHGRTIEARGLDVVGAHAVNYNTTYWGWELMVGIGWAPTDAQLRRTREVCHWLEGHASAQSDTGTRFLVKGHGQLNPDQCPGPDIQKWINAGMPQPATVPQATYDLAKTAYSAALGQLQSKLDACTASGTALAAQINDLQTQLLGAQSETNQANQKVADLQTDIDGWATRAATLSADMHMRLNP